MRLLGEGTIEEGMYEIAQDKLHLEQQITDEGGKCYTYFLLLFNCKNNIYSQKMRAQIKRVY